MTANIKIFLIAAAIIGIGLAIFWLRQFSFMTDQKKASVLLSPSASDPFLGDRNAPVTVIEVADIQCPGHKSFFDLVEPDLRKNYIDKGKVKFYFWELLMVPESEKPSEALRCVQDQGKYWEYRDLTLRQPRKEGGWVVFTKENLMDFAEDLNLDSQIFSNCLDSGKYRDFILEKDRTARNFGVVSSPTIFINGVKRPGIVSQQELYAAIDRELRQLTK